MKNNFIILIIILLFLIFYSSFNNEYFSNNEEKEINEKIEKSENKLIKIIKNIIQNNDKFPIIQGPTGPQGPQGPAGSKFLSSPDLIYNKKFDMNKIMTVQGKSSNSKEICNFSFMTDKHNNLFDIEDESKWNKIESDAGYFKIQSYNNPEKCLSYNEDNKIFLANCNDKKYYSNWKKNNKKYQTENITDKIQNKCLSVSDINENERKECNIPNEITNILKLDVCNDNDNQIWTI